MLRDLEVLVELLLSLAGILLSIARHLLLFVASNGANNAVLLALYTIHTALDVSLMKSIEQQANEMIWVRHTFSFSGVDFSFTAGVFFLSGSLP